MNKRICDYCGEPWPKHHIKLSRTPNAESLYAELCDVCLEDIVNHDLASAWLRYKRELDKPGVEAMREFLDEIKEIKEDCPDITKEELAALRPTPPKKQEPTFAGFMDFIAMEGGKYA